MAREEQWRRGLDSVFVSYCARFFSNDYHHSFHDFCFWVAVGLCVIGAAVFFFKVIGEESQQRVNFEGELHSFGAGRTVEGV